MSSAASSRAHEPASLDDVRRLVSLIWRPGDVYELRGIAKLRGQKHVTFGFFDNLRISAMPLWASGP
jgi:hypothetical protein